MILSLKILIIIIGYRLGKLSPYDFAIDCCESEGVPYLCQGGCVPEGAAPTGRKRLKCSKHANKMYKCKKGKLY